MTIDEMIGKIRAAASNGEWRQVQPLMLEIKRLMADRGRALSASHAAQLVEALASAPPLEATASGGLDAGPLIAKVRELVTSRNVDRKALQSSWDSLYQLLADPTARIDQEDLQSLLLGMRSARAFDLLAKTADRALTRMPDDATSRRLYGQALIDTGQIHAGIEMLKSTLSIATLAEKERNEVHGLLGRAYKQLYVDHVTSASTSPQTRQRFKPDLQQSIDHYGKVYDPNKPDRNYWHGINLVALLLLARDDGHTDINNPTGVPADDLAQRMIARLEPQAADTNDPWILSTVAECYLARHDFDTAAKYFILYAKHPKTDPFALTGTVRQLEQVFRLDAGQGPGGRILAALKEAQIAKPEGKFALDGDQLQQLRAFAGSPEHRRLSETMVQGGGFVKLGLLQTVVGRAASIAALCNDSGATLGSGFIVRGLDLKTDWGNDLFLVTNAHVMSDPTLADYESSSPLQPANTKIKLEGANNLRLSCEPKAVWQSPIAGHDATIVKLNCDTSSITPLPICKPDLRLQTGDPEREEAQAKGSRVSVIGYPLGGPLSLSVVGSISGANGLLVDVGPRQKGDADPVYLHYRAPTEPGNSGSPVFETETWTIVGLHHEGFDKFDGRPKLDGKPGRSHANEGISIHSIRREINRR